MGAGPQSRPHLHRLDDYDDYDEDGGNLLHHLRGLIRHELVRLYSASPM